MSSLSDFFAPLLTFLDAPDARTALETWVKGPTVVYRHRKAVPVADYTKWLETVETSPALRGQGVKKIVQRIRRVSFSEFTEVWKSPTSGLMDMMIADTTTYGDPPLTTDHIDAATLNGLFETATIMTARGLEVDVAHLWPAIDFALSGESASTRGGRAILDSEPEALISWSGDLGGVTKDWAREVLSVGRARRTEARSQEIMLKHVDLHAAKADILGDMDGTILARRWKGQAGLVVSKAFAQYYADDALPQAQAKAKPYPTSARRFHHFLEAVVPALPASGRGSTPLEITVNKVALEAALRQAFIAAADDTITGGNLLGVLLSAQSKITEAGPQFDKLCAHFTTFLAEGLTSGDAPWPPATW